VDSTTRQRVTAALREAPASASDLAGRLDVPRSVVYDHLRHVARSLDPADERFLVAPPECRACGFADFDDPVAHPSRCPACRAERIEEAVFVVRDPEDGDGDGG
jgi:predicted Zn-ribbon and HTH transcriptional regulator